MNGLEVKRSVVITYPTCATDIVEKYMEERNFEPGKVYHTGNGEQHRVFFPKSSLTEKDLSRITDELKIKINGHD